MLCQFCCAQHSLKDAGAIAFGIEQKQGNVRHFVVFLKSGSFTTGYIGNPVQQVLTAIKRRARITHQLSARRTCRVMYLHDHRQTLSNVCEVVQGSLIHVMPMYTNTDRNTHGCADQQLQPSASAEQGAGPLLCLLYTSDAADE